MIRKINFKTPYFLAEYTLEGDEREVDIITEVADLINFCEEIKFPTEVATTEKSPKKAFTPATEKQVALLKKYNIPYTSKTSCEEASQLIKASIAKSR